MPIVQDELQFIVSYFPITNWRPNDGKAETMIKHARRKRSVMFQYSTRKIKRHQSPQGSIFGFCIRLLTSFCYADQKSQLFILCTYLKVFMTWRFCVHPSRTAGPRTQLRGVAITCISCIVSEYMGITTKYMLAYMYWVLCVNVRVLTVCINRTKIIRRSSVLKT